MQCTEQKLLARATSKTIGSAGNDREEDFKFEGSESVYSDPTIGIRPAFILEALMFEASCCVRLSIARKSLSISCLSASPPDLVVFRLSRREALLTHELSEI